LCCPVHVTLYIIYCRMYNNNNEKLVLRNKMQMQAPQRTPLSNRETRNSTNVSSTYSWNLKKRLSYHASLWEGSFMKLVLRNRSCGFCILSIWRMPVSSIPLATFGASVIMAAILIFLILGMFTVWMNPTFVSFHYRE